ncbi:MAG: hypothetical protein CMB65_00100, partial [Euryarchaeota archaeon]|nr:hypothetical protein [Euryarchaeota archaeon]
MKLFLPNYSLAYLLAVVMVWWFWICMPRVFWKIWRSQSHLYPQCLKSPIISNITSSRTSFSVPIKVQLSEPAMLLKQL